ncbi:MAG TPA: helix-turn-helix domain-containing protein [Terriglobales bacterium]
MTLSDSERALILRTLEVTGWVIGGSKGAAALLGLKRTTLTHRMKKLGIKRPRYRAGLLEMPAIPEQSKTPTELDQFVAAY